MNGNTLRTLSAAESASVAAGYDPSELAVAVAAGAAAGAPVGAVLLAPVGVVFGTAMGGLVGGFFGAGYYAASELFDYCF